MLDLPIPEIVIFVFAIVVHAAAAIAGIVQLLAGGKKYKGLLRYLGTRPLILLAILLEAGILVFRAAAIRAVPLTGLFESVILLILVLGLTYLLLSIAVRQVWFGSVMVWVILCLVVLAAAVAEPASAAHSAASTPWAIAHAVAMILGGAAAMLACASAVLYLLGRRKLKQKRAFEVLGRVPNLEKLERMNLFGLKACFVLMTLGLASGVGLAATSTSLDMTARDWLTDAKIVLVAAVWLLLGLILVLQSRAKLRERTVACLTIVAFALILYALVGTSVFCGTKHDFAGNQTEASEQDR